MASRTTFVDPTDGDVRPASLEARDPTTLGVVRALLALFLAALLLAPAGVSAQADAGPASEEGEPIGGTEASAEPAIEEGETESAEGTAVEGGGYEPDQRGAQEPEGEYEPDQRGFEREEIAEGDAPMATGVDAEAYDSGSTVIGLDVQLWLGGGLIGLDAIDGANLLRPEQRSSFGASFGLVGALRIGPISVGPRIGVTVEPGFTMATFGGDVQAVLTSDRFAPFVRASLSYAFLAGLADPLPSQPDARVDGVLVELGVGARFRVAGPFVIGAELSGGYLHLERGAVPACEAPCGDGDFDLATPGSADGLTLRLHLFGGVSF